MALHNAKPTPAKRWTLLPLIGSGLFLLLYLLAAAFYPGGSQADAHAEGFSWLHNYWCNLLPPKGINGQPNAARPFAVAAMAVLVFTLLSFWVAAARRLRFSKTGRMVLLFSALASMALLPFLSSAHHDAVINASAAFGLVAMAMVYAALYKEGKTFLFAFGLFNLGLVALNNYVYYATESLYWLPLVQKVTFASFLLWVCAVSVMLANRERSGA